MIEHVFLIKRRNMKEDGSKSMKALGKVHRVLVELVPNTMTQTDEFGTF